MIAKMRGQANLIYLIGTGVSLMVAAVGWGFALASPSKTEVGVLQDKVQALEISKAGSDAEVNVRLSNLDKNVESINKKMDILLKIK